LTRKIQNGNTLKGLFLVSTSTQNTVNAKLAFLFPSMNSSSEPRVIQPRAGLRRPDYGPMQHRFLRRAPGASVARTEKTLTNLGTSVLPPTGGNERMSRGDELLASLQSMSDPIEASRNIRPIQSHQPIQINQSAQSNQPRTGLRRPDYGSMQHRVFNRTISTSYITKRRTVVDENLRNAFHQAYIGNQQGSGSVNNVEQEKAAVIQSERVKVDDGQRRTSTGDNQFWPSDVWCLLYTFPFQRLFEQYLDDFY
jgi:hypothetical protein